MSHALKCYELKVRVANIKCVGCEFNLRDQPTHFHRHDVDITGVLLTMRIQQEYTQSQYREGASDVNIH